MVRQIPPYFILMVTVLCMLHSACSVKVRGETCVYLEDCDTKICEYVSGHKICGCFYLPDYGTGENVEQYYNQGICQSKVNQMCTLPDAKWNGPAWEFTCVINAQCSYAEYAIGSVWNFGVCVCLNGFVASNDGNICVKQWNVAVPTLSEPEILTSKASPTQVYNATDQITIAELVATNTTISAVLTPVEISMLNQAEQFITSEQIQTDQTQTSEQTQTEQTQTEQTQTSEQPRNKEANISSMFSNVIKKLGLATSNHSTIDDNTQVNKGFGHSCIANEECITRFCDPGEKHCVCNKLMDHALNRTVDRIYSDGKCLSRIHQTCTMTNLNTGIEMETLKCVLGTTCTTKFNKNWHPIGHGICVCRDGFKSNINKTKCNQNIMQINAVEFLKPKRLSVLFYIFLQLL